MTDEVARLQRRLDRAQKKVAILEEMMEEKTRDLYLQQQTLQAAKDDLLSIVFGLNHDLKSPLTTIEGFAAAMQEDLRDEDYEDLPWFADKIAWHCGRLRKLIANLVKLAEQADGADLRESVDLALIFDMGQAVGRLGHQCVWCDREQRLSALLLSSDNATLSSRGLAASL